MRYPTLPQEGVFMEALIWANEICNAKFDWFSRKETKSTYEKRPFSTRATRFLIWAFPQIPPPLGNASFDWILLKETKSTYEKQPFSEEKPQDRVNPLFSPNFRNEERKIIKEGTRHTRHTRHTWHTRHTRHTGRIKKLPVRRPPNNEYAIFKKGSWNQLKEKLDFYAKLSGLPIFKLGNYPYVTA